MPFIEELGIDTVQLPHAEGQIAVRGLNEKEIVVRHETVAMANPIIAFIKVLEGVQEVFAVCVILEDRLLLVFPRSDMINCAGIFYAEGARDEAKENTNAKPQDKAFVLLNRG